MRRKYIYIYILTRIVFHGRLVFWLPGILRDTCAFADEVILSTDLELSKDPGYFLAHFCSTTLFPLTPAAKPHAVTTPFNGIIKKELPIESINKPDGGVLAIVVDLGRREGGM
ncbi:hypothetical protein HanXRQr2_Chr13g0598531 [Helianthus annuus]|uniref:Uncharacterized protein n=1 Tax=Helianthus annuus TaxID=4232 RepID=A0A9K3HB34_HELAN|nr:hypothetical protein HanXRQr2_Chr13g0598531 [Helianthus annuus]KAJ0850091.1 hypothetical protein HanPSC8_Chr13g0576581 [Helianthus annuus]